MDVDVFVPLLITAVFLDVMEVVTADDNSVRHLSLGNAKPLEHASTDGHVPSERALLVNKVALGGKSRGLESKANVLHISHGLGLLDANNTLLSNEDGVLLLVCLLVLVGLAVFIIESHFEKV